MDSKQYVLIHNNSDAELAVEQTARLFGLAWQTQQFVDKSSSAFDAITIRHTFISYPQGTASICEVFYTHNNQLQYRARREYFNDCSDRRQRRWLVRLNLYRLLTDVIGVSPSPWGTLSGIRPTKLVRKLLAVHSQSAVTRLLSQQYAVEPLKAQLITELAVRQQQLLSHEPNTISIYIGIPFCPSRCLYCSFPGELLPEPAAVNIFMKALYLDMAAAAAVISAQGYTVNAIYIGGGTPTSLSTANLEQLLAKTLAAFGTPGEFTVEAGRPDTLTADKIKLLSDYGVTRVSVNPQTMQQKTLKLIGRMHTVQAIIDTFGQIRKQSIPIVNMDIIAGLPGETAEDMADTLAQILALRPDNLTVHTLAIKRGSRLGESVQKYSLPTADITIKMLAQAEQAALALGMHPYYLYRQKNMSGNLENIGYSLPGYECSYNLHVIEEDQIIIGIGPGATTKIVDRGRLRNWFLPKDVKTYIQTLPNRLQQRTDLLNSYKEVSSYAD